MDASICSSMSKALSSTEASASAEESDWTTYFEDFFVSQNREEEEEEEEEEAVGKYCPTEKCHGGSSMISDATSGAARKPRATTGASDGSKKLSFEKRKSRKVVGNDPFEDTASSPVSSPKVLHEKGARCAKFTEEIGREEMDDFGFTDQNVNECINLKKKGLCLVPLSMFVDYLE